MFAAMITITNEGFTHLPTAQNNTIISNHLKRKKKTCTRSVAKRLVHSTGIFGIHAVRYVYIIDQVRGQDGWILAEFSFCVFMDRDEVEVHKNVKRERGQYPAILTELAWSIKDLLYDMKSTEKSDLRTSLFSSTEKEPR